jgi:hypothetical protein
MKSDAERSWAANRGYDDSAGIYYSYDSNVANSRRIKEGDLVVVRTDDYVAGFGYVERIEREDNAAKEIRLCPVCRQTRWRLRSSMVPSGKCDACGAEFDASELMVELRRVTKFRAYYANTWTEAARPTSRSDPLLRDALATEDTFNAMRPLDIGKVAPLLDWISGTGALLEPSLPPVLADAIRGGHVTAIVRRRRGQREFRFRMMERFGERCAFTGDQPPQTLEAAHLYQYAVRPEHHPNGGLLLRRDHHALFDAKLIAVNPDSWRIETAPVLDRFPTYKSVDGAELRLEPAQRPDRELIAVHYEEAQRVFRRSA